MCKYVVSKLADMQILLCALLTSLTNMVNIEIRR